MAVERIPGKLRDDFIGLSTDTKPTSTNEERGLRPGSKFHEVQVDGTIIDYLWSGSNWGKQVVLVKTQT